MGNGTFGLDREAIILRSGVREIFTPHTPIDEVDHFFGREEEAARLVSVINSPGQHILLYGDRGVGKTSLAMTTCKAILQQLQGGHFFEKRCDSGDSFASIFEDPLLETGIDLSLQEQSSTHHSGGNAGITTFFANAGVRSDRSTTKKTKLNYRPDSPSWVANQISHLKGIFLIDETDAISKEDDKKKLAEVIKLLSDSKSKFKIIVVGIAKTGEELTAGHPSVERCLKEVSLKRMSDSALRKMILNGMKRLDIIPNDAVVEKIINISAGFPHFTHLICLKCAENSLVSRNRHINEKSLASALEASVEESEGALRRLFDTTLRYLAKPQEYRLLLLGAAYCRTPDFRISELKNKLEDTLNVSVDPKLLSRRLGTLTKGEGKTILCRPARGVFQFTDPRMPCFIKMALDSERASLRITALG
ncbi:AAA family ATPase [Litchfieldella xinjiangensis]|uniref:AAA family ATPase n=1 Tax=Litchfieldella xinjiangensis TaxID=1166948 RepID=UPI000B002E70|nr:AAA family ATPase [Halomonas xinjiangensis]